MTLPQTFSEQDVIDAFGLSPAALDKLIRDGRVGYYVAKRRRRFLPEHVAQIVAAIEVKPDAVDNTLTRIGVTSRAARRRVS